MKFYYWLQHHADLLTSCLLAVKGTQVDNKDYIYTYSPVYVPTTPGSWGTFIQYFMVMENPSCTYQYFNVKINPRAGA